MAKYPVDKHDEMVDKALAHAKEGKLTDEDYEVLCIEIVANVMNLPVILDDLGLPDKVLNEVCDEATEQLMNHDKLALKALRDVVDSIDDDRALMVVKAFVDTLE